MLALKPLLSAVIDLDPKASVKADLKTKQVIVNTQAPELSVKEAISAAGYPPA